MGSNNHHEVPDPQPVEPSDGCDDLEAKYGRFSESEQPTGPHLAPLPDLEMILSSVMDRVKLLEERQQTHMQRLIGLTAVCQALLEHQHCNGVVVGIGRLQNLLK